MAARARKPTLPLRMDVVGIDFDAAGLGAAKGVSTVKPDSVPARRRFSAQDFLRVRCVNRRACERCPEGCLILPTVRNPLGVAVNDVFDRELGMPVDSAIGRKRHAGPGDPGAVFAAAAATCERVWRCFQNPRCERLRFGKLKVEVVQGGFEGGVTHFGAQHVKRAWRPCS